MALTGTVFGGRKRRDSAAEIAGCARRAAGVSGASASGIRGGLSHSAVAHLACRRGVVVRLCQAVLTLLVPAICVSSAGARNTCVECHKELGGELSLPATQLPESIHGRARLTCFNCHGGDPEAEDMEESMSALKGYVGAPTRGEIPAFCGKCHSDERYMRRYRPRIAVDQEMTYWTSRHGMKLREGDEKVAQCVSCHGSHSIKAVKDPGSTVYPTNVPSTCNGCHGDAEYMAEYGIPTDQFDSYAASVHGVALLQNGDIGAPACNDCHGNHGASPPGVTSVANVCGHCHASAGGMFVMSPHKAAFDEMGLSECVTCHGNHAVRPPSDEMLGVEEEAVCVECHGEGEAGYAAADVMKSAIISLKAKLSETTTLVKRAEQAGMEMSDEEFQLRDAENQLVMARNLIHTLDPDTVTAVVAEGDTTLAELERAGLEALNEVSRRRRGFGMSAAIIALVIAGLYLTLRDIERRQRGG